MNIFFFSQLIHKKQTYFGIEVSVQCVNRVWAEGFRRFVPFSLSLCEMMTDCLFPSLGKPSGERAQGYHLFMLLNCVKPPFNVITFKFDQDG